jgi:hypothetical protein
MVEDDDVGSEATSVLEGSPRITHLMQAELEEDEVRARLNGEEIARHQSESVHEPGVRCARRQPFDRSRVSIDGDHLPDGPRVLDELTAAGADRHDRLVRKIVELSEVRHDLGEIRRHATSCLENRCAIRPI